MAERVMFRTFLDEEEAENRLSCNSRKWVSERRAVPSENDDGNDDGDDWKVGAWRSATGVCKLARERRGQAVAAGAAATATARRTRGLSRDESSFESLDLRAAEVLDRSMQALESTTSLTSLTSCASGISADYLHWKGGRGGWEEVEKPNSEVVVGRRDEWDTLQSLRSSHRGGLPKTSAAEPDRAFRVLKDLVNSNTDYSVKLSTTVAKAPEDTMARLSVEDLNVLNSQQNACEEDQLSCYARGNVSNGLPRGTAVNGDQEPPSSATQDDMLKKGAEKDCRSSSPEERRDVTRATSAALNRLTQTELTGLSGCKMLPPKGKRSPGDWRLPTRPKGEQLQIYMKINSAASQRRRNKFLKNNDSEQRKRMFPSKPPKWKGLSTALSVIRSMCHGAGEAGVVEAQSRPLLIIAGKCVFRTSPPLDTPRVCTVSHPRKCHVENAFTAGEESLPPTSGEDTRTASAHNQLPSKSLLTHQTSFDDHLRPTPGYTNSRFASASIKPWPAVVTELDNWISQTVNEWLEKNDRLPTVPKSSPSHTSAAADSPNILPSRIGVHSEEKLGESKRLTELDARIGQAQTVRDLRQLLEPMSSVLDSQVLGGDIKSRRLSILQEFEQDDVVQQFQRQIHTLEQENEDLKSSLCKDEHSDLFQRLKSLCI